MRNPFVKRLLSCARSRLPVVALGWSAVVAVAGGVVGCGPDPEARSNLVSGYDSLRGNRYDEAIGRADAALAQTPGGGPGTAEALYLRGRALEQRGGTGQSSDPKADFAAAQSAYLEALAAKPSTQLEAYIHASLGNVAYWRDDYSEAMQQWTAAYGRTGNPDVDPFVLYRIGLCQQRLGQFNVADQTFATVIQRYPSTEAADRARSHSGFKAFTVQVATFESAAAADKLTADLRRDNLNPSRSVAPRGLHVVSVGPFPNYVAAQQVKTRLAPRFPDAVIIP